MSRRSSVYRPRNSTIHRRSNIPEDMFNILDPKEINVSLQQYEFSVTEEMVSKPTPEFFISLTEAFVDTFMAISEKKLQEKVEKLINKSKYPQVKDAMEGIETNNGEENKENELQDEETTSALSLIVLFRAASRFYQTCGIEDFSLMDLTRPEPFKTRRILSAVVNFVRFRERNSSGVDDLLAKGDNAVEKLKVLDQDITSLQNKIEEITNILKANESVRQVQLYNSKVEVQFRRLKKRQDAIAEEHEQNRAEKQKLVQRVEELEYLIEELIEDIAKLKECDQIDINSLNGEIEELKSKYVEHQEFLNGLESKQKNIFIGIESLQKVDSDLSSSIRVLNDIVHDMGENERLSNDLLKYQEIYNQLVSRSNDLDRDIEQFKIQISLNEEKIKKLNEEAEEASKNHTKTLSALRLRYDDNMKEVIRIDKQLINTREEVEAIENEIIKVKADFQSDERQFELRVRAINNGVKAHIEEINSKI